MAGQVGGGLGPAGDLELGEDAGDVVLDRLLGQPKVLADLAVGAAVGDLGEDALLLGGQAGQLLVAEQVLALAQAVKAEERGMALQRDGARFVCVVLWVSKVTTGRCQQSLRIEH